MNTIYPKRHIVDSFIAKLIQEPCFLDGTLTMYADVPVKCVHYAPNYCNEGENLCSAPDKYRYDALDYLVCRGDIAVACICFNPDHSRESAQRKELFGSYLLGLDCLSYSAEAQQDDALDEFYQFVTQRLGTYAQSGAACTDYTLVAVQLAADTLTLKRNCLLEEYGYAPVFRRDCGIFFRCQTEEDGTFRKEPMTCNKTFQEQTKALSWRSERNGDTAQLQRILDTSLAEFCGNNTERFTEFQMHLNAFKEALDGFPVIEISDTYGDFLQAYSDCFQNPLPPSSRKAICIVMTKLLLVLAQVIHEEGIPFFQIPLYRYYTAAANLAGCYYPLWLYHNMIRPHLCNQPEDFFTMCDYALYKCVSLNLLMAEPICVPGRGCNLKERR